MLCLQTVQHQSPSPLQDLAQTQAATPSEVFDVNIQHYFYVRVAINCILFHNIDPFLYQLLCETWNIGKQMGTCCTRTNTGELLLKMANYNDNHSHDNHSTYFVSQKVLWGD